MAFQRPSAPVREPMTDAQRIIRLPWSIYFRDLRADLDNTAAQVIPPVQLTGQTATIPTTPFDTPALEAGLYSVAWYGQVLTAAGVSSSFQVTISWTRNGVSQTYVGALKNGNTTATNEANGPPLIHIDASTPISYAVTYASNPGAAMIFEINLVLTQVSAD